MPPAEVPDPVEPSGGWRHYRSDPAFLGTAFGIAAAIGYTGANVFLRVVADCDPSFVSCIKAIPTVVLFAPWLLIRRLQGQPIWPSPGSILALLAVGILGQLGGNLMFQMALGRIGIAVVVPLTMGGMIVSGAVLGRIFLAEVVDARSLLAIIILTSAIVVLSLGADSIDAGDSATDPVAASGTDPYALVVGVTAACVAGISWAIMGMVIRKEVQQGTSVAFTLVLMGVLGVLILGASSVQQYGMDIFLTTATDDLLIMLLAGIWNAVAFLALTKALQQTTLLRVNLLNASQVMMAALAGVFFFQEPASIVMFVGVALTIAGLSLMGPRKPRPQP